MTTEDDFHRALDANPEDHHTRLVFADWLQDHDDPRAEGYRALGTLRVHPLLTNGYWGHTHDGNTAYRPHALPRDWYNMTGMDAQQGANWQLHDTRHEAEDTAALAFQTVPHERRAEILGQQSQKLSRRVFSRRTGRYYT